MFKWKKCEKHSYIKYDHSMYNCCPMCGRENVIDAWMGDAIKKRQENEELKKSLANVVAHDEETMAENNQLDKHVGIYDDAMCELEEFCDRFFVDKERCEDCLGGCTACDNFKGR